MQSLLVAAGLAHKLKQDQRAVMVTILYFQPSHQRVVAAVGYVDQLTDDKSVQTVVQVAARRQTLARLMLAV